MQRRTNARRRGVAARPRSLQNAPAALQKPRQHPRGDTMNPIRITIAGALLAALAHEALAHDTYILATGRRDPRMYAIDLKAALKPENQNTPNAIVSRSKTALDRLDGRPLGDPGNVVISEDRKTAYVVNHH